MAQSLKSPVLCVDSLVTPSVQTLFTHITKDKCTGLKNK